MATNHFRPVKTRRVRTGSCPTCGRKVQRSKTFENTVNPFNRNDDGTVRTPEQVRAHVNDLADAWEPDFHHETCA